MSSKRKNRIESACLRAKKRDNFTCQVCGNKFNVEAAHLMPRKISRPRYNPADEKFIVTLCSWHHKEFDSFSGIAKKIEWLDLKGLELFRDRVIWISDMGINTECP